MITAVLFDWGGTLTPWHTIDARELWQAVVRDGKVLPAVAAVVAPAGQPDAAALSDVARLSDAGPDPEPEDENEAAVRLSEALYAAEQEMWVRSRDEHRSSTLADVCEAAGVALTADLLAAHERHWEPHTYTDPEAAGVLAGLRERGLKVGLLSNTQWSREHHERILSRDGVLELFDGAVYTSEIPWTKPHPEAFRAAMDAVGVSDAAECVYVGDRLFDDIYGAQAAGMRAIHIPHSPIPASQIGHTVGEPDAVIQSLPELIPLLENWKDPH
jgi:putative hydrolase of the HAD superfamily